ncbi:unnamed protein product, partial [Musa textilis]
VDTSPASLLVRSLSTCLLHYHLYEFSEVATVFLQVHFESNDI